METEDKIELNNLEHKNSKKALIFVGIAVLIVGLGIYYVASLKSRLTDVPNQENIQTDLQVQQKSIENAALQSTLEIKIPNVEEAEALEIKLLPPSLKILILEEPQQVLVSQILSNDGRKGFRIIYDYPGSLQNFSIAMTRTLRNSINNESPWKVILSHWTVNFGVIQAQNPVYDVQFNQEQVEADKLKIEVFVWGK